MLQLSRFERIGPVPVSSWNLPFREYPGINVRSLWIFQVDYDFCKPDVEILAANDKIKCVRCSSQPYYHKQYFFVTSKEVRETSLRINTVCIFFTREKCCETE